MAEVDKENKPLIEGLTGEMQLSRMGKRAKKKFLDEKRKQEEEEILLKERILKAKQDYETEKKQKL